MDTKDILKGSETTKRLIHNEDYYKYIFKKTERIVSVVFYIAYNLEVDKKTQQQIDDILHAASVAHDALIRSLEVRTHMGEEAIRAGAHALIALESKLRVGHASGLFGGEVMHVLDSEIDAVLRGMNKYLRAANAADDIDYQLAYVDESPQRERTVRKVASHAGVTSETKPATPQAPSPDSDRRGRISRILRERGESTIKDISMHIKDCSEKTIQRELNAMIEDNIVKRHGERRWSRYSLF